MPAVPKSVRASLLFASLCYLCAVVYAYAPWVERPASALARPGDQFIEVSGHRLRYRRTAAAVGKPSLVLLHGFAGSLHVFDGLAAALAHSVDVIAVDLMPFGLSDKPDDYAYTFQNQAATIDAFAHALGLSRYAVGGHSYGGTVAAYTAATSSRVDELVLIDPGIYNTGVPALARYLVFPLPRIGARLFAQRDFRRRFVQKSLVEPQRITEAFMDELMRGTQMEGFLDGTTAMFAASPDPDVPFLLSHIRQPTLLVWGRLDRNNPVENAQRMRHALRRAQVAIIDSAAHYPHLERPREVAAAIRGFMAAEERTRMEITP
jgi:pimeloyl-ACP methyl ester carboxylesterase